MAEAGRILGASLDVEATLRQVAQLAVPVIAEWCAIDLLTPDGTLGSLATAHQDPAKSALLAELRRDYPADPNAPVGAYAVVRERRTMTSEVSPESMQATAVDDRHRHLMAALDLHSWMCAPMLVGDRVLGTIAFAGSRSGQPFGPRHVAFAETLASRAGAALENARAYRTADRFRRILDAVAEAVFVIDPADGRIREINKGALDLLGVPPDALLGHSLWDVLTDLPALDAASLLAPLVDERLDARTVDATVRAPNGDLIPVEILLQRVDLAVEPAAIVAIARDIRERVESQRRTQRLAQAEHARATELNAIIRAIGDGVVVCTGGGQVTLMNPAARALLGRDVPATYAELVGRLLDPEHAAPSLGMAGGPVVLATRRDPDRWVEIATYPVSGERRGGTDVAETIVVLRDVTAARRRDAIRETFIGVLSHELRTPVTTIYGGSKLLARPDSNVDEGTRRAVFADIAAEAERLQRLVEDVVAMNRFGESGGDPGKEPVLLQRVVPGVVASEETRWPGARFSVELPPGLPTVTADPIYVEQVVRNLLSNAAKYGSPEPHIRIILEPGDHEVRVRILDDGPGITADEADRVFELFYRSPRTSRTTGGAGIGLFVCARLVQAMGGRIWARPQPEGGSEFGFSLRVMTED